MKPDNRHHTCCGKRKRGRMIDGKLVEQEHKCQDDTDVRGVDWTQIKQKESA